MKKQTQIKESDIIQNFSKKAMNGFVWASSTSLVTQIVNWVFTIMTARILAPSDYGTMALVHTVMLYLLMISNFNMEPWYIHLEKMNKETEKTVCSLALLFGTISTLICFFVAPYVGEFYDNDQVTLGIRLMSLNFIFYGLAMVPTSRLKRELEFKKISLINTIVGISQVILVYVLALNGFGLLSLLIGYTYKVVVSNIAFIITGGGLPGFDWDNRIIKSIIKFGSPATGANLMHFIFSTSDEVIIGKFLGVEILGYYSMAYYLVIMPSDRIAQIIKPLLLSYFSRMRSYGEKFVTIFYEINKFSAWVIFPILIGMSAVSDEFVNTVYGEKWAPMIWPLSVLCIVGILKNLTDILSSLIIAHGRPDIDFKINFCSAIIFPIAFYILIQQYELNGALLVWILVYPLIPIFNLVELKKLQPINLMDFFLVLKKPILFSAVMFFSLFLFDTLFETYMSQFNLLVVKIIIGMLTYLLLSYIFFYNEIKGAVKIIKEK